MIRDLAEETVDGSAFDDFSASSMLAIIGRQVGVMTKWFVQSPNDTRSCRRSSCIDGSAFDDFSASSMLGDRLGLCLIGLFKFPKIRDLAE